MTAPARQPLEALPELAAGLSLLDAPGKKIAKAVRGALGPGTVKDAISGVWMGHALHPLLTDVVIGSWTSANLLDLLGGEDTDEAAQRLIAVGIAAYPSVAVTGLVDWADGEPVGSEVRRIGLVHAALNSVALGLYVASLVNRRKGNRATGVALALAGSAWMGAAGHLGGHLAFRLGQGVDQTVFDAGSGDWSDALAAEDLREDEPATAQVGETPVVLVRDGEDVLALHDRCSHRGCSLATGDVHDGAIECPCHGSRFDLRSGAVRRGPATAPQPAFQARTRAGRIEVRLHQ
ncbi:MAG: hypothetical protein QOI73_2561 [Solirubrobacteraceae bacterium]|nr:hypothetical protein [Solirubrobacteraceae bacterium]